LARIRWAQSYAETARPGERLVWLSGWPWLIQASMQGFLQLNGTD
jgi:hypothetical protein